MREETPIIFQCHDNKLVGIVHHSNNTEKLGILLVVGGPQYRVGSHRQFVLLARMLAANDIPVMRFDYQGMGDAEGEARTFVSVDDDIARAIAAFYQTCPNLQGIVIWGLCDAASAALFYAYQDERVRGLILLNPWVYTEQGAATAYLKHYYLQRLLNPDLWRKIFTLKFDYLGSVVSLVGILKNLLGNASEADNSAEKPQNSQPTKVDSTLSLPIRMQQCMQRFKNPVLLILSGKDLTAAEFKDVTSKDSEWQTLLADDRVTRHDLIESDHTFSSKAWRDQVAEWSLEWINALNQKR